MIETRFKTAWNSANGIPVEEGQVVLYSDGSVMSKCIVRKVHLIGRRQYMRPRNIHLEVVMSQSYEIGHMFKHCRSAIRLWVLDETSEEAVEKSITEPFKWQR